CLHLQHIRIADRKVLRLQLWIEQSLIRLIERPVAAVVREHSYGERPHSSGASRPSLPLKEGGHSAGRLVLDDRADMRIVEAYFERRSSNDDVGVRNNACVLRCGTTDDESLSERVADVLAHSPALTFNVTGSIINPGPAQGREGLAPLI